MFQTDPFALIALLVGLSLVAFVAMIATSYLKIVVVISLVRNALGIQSIPPNMVVNALALILTFYIMAPVVGESWDLFNKYREENKPDKEYRTDMALKAAEPLRQWLVRQTSDRERAFFVSTAERLWAKPGEEKAKVDPEGFQLRNAECIVFSGWGLLFTENSGMEVCRNGLWINWETESGQMIRHISDMRKHITGN